MDRLIYTSLSALRGAMTRQTATANNLANASTPGFRADIADAQAVWLRGSSLEARSFGVPEVLAADMRAGATVQTGNALDLAVSGDAMLAVQCSDGSEGYTRRGDLEVSASGLLTTGDGAPVLGANGPISVPPFDEITIAADGSVQIVPPGGNRSEAQTIDKLKLVAPTGQPLAKGLDGIFRTEEGAVLPEDPDGKVITGHLENSNVSATHALVEMIEAGRAWDTQIRMIGDARDMDAATADLMRMPN